MDDMGDMEMDMESMMGGGDGVKTGDGPQPAGGRPLQHRAELPCPPANGDDSQ